METPWLDAVLTLFVHTVLTALVTSETLLVISVPIVCFNSVTSWGLYLYTLSFPNKKIEVGKGLATELAIQYSSLKKQFSLKICSQKWYARCKIHYLIIQYTDFKNLGHLRNLRVENFPGGAIAMIQFNSKAWEND